MDLFSLDILQIEIAVIDCERSERRTLNYLEELLRYMYTGSCQDGSTTVIDQSAREVLQDSVGSLSLPHARQENQHSLQQSPHTPCRAAVGGS